MSFYSTVRGRKATVETLGTPLQRKIDVKSAIKLSEALDELIPSLCKNCKAVLREKIPSFEIEKVLQNEERLTREGNRQETKEFEQFYED